MSEKASINQIKGLVSSSVKGPVSGHPREAEQVFITGAGRLQKFSL